MSAMADMSRAIRVELQMHGPTLEHIDGQLREYMRSSKAFTSTLKEELGARRAVEGVSSEPMY